MINSGEITSVNKILQEKKQIKDKNNNKIWQHIIQFNKIDIINNVISFVTSSQIKDSKKHGPVEKTSLNRDYYVKWIAVVHDLKFLKKIIFV